MELKATANNVILQVENKKKSAEELLIDTGEQESILVGQIVAVGDLCSVRLAGVKEKRHQACAYMNRVALLPWEINDSKLYVVKEENIYGIIVEDE